MGYRGLYIFFSFGVCAVMMVLGGLQSQRLGCCVPGKLSGCWVGGVTICVDACVAWWLWLVICEPVVRLFS